MCDVPVTKYHLNAYEIKAHVNAQLHYYITDCWILMGTKNVVFVSMKFKQRKAELLSHIQRHLWNQPVLLACQDIFSLEMQAVNVASP